MTHLLALGKRQRLDYESDESVASIGEIEDQTESQTKQQYNLR